MMLYGWGSRPNTQHEPTALLPAVSHSQGIPCPRGALHRAQAQGVMLSGETEAHRGWAHSSVLPFLHLGRSVPSNSTLMMYSPTAGR